MYNVVFYDEANFDYESIWNYIWQDNLFYANEVLNKIDKSIDIISEFPYIWTELDKTHKQIVEPKYKFKVVYKLWENTIYIVSIFREQEKL
jgi:plasmid stabilization system protein ParE